MHPCPRSTAGIGRAFVIVAVPAATVKVPGRRKGVSVNNQQANAKNIARVDCFQISASKKLNKLNVNEHNPSKAAIVNDER